MLTLAGKIIFLVVFALAFILFFRRAVKELGIESIEVDTERKSRYAVAVLLSIALATLPSGMLLIATDFFSNTTDNYRTIYSNKIEATVSFMTSYDQVEFVGGKQLKDETDNTYGVLTLSKDGVKLSRSIEDVDYIGHVEKGSIVEKIEYSNSVKESKLFGIALMIEKSDRLKIHLKKPTSEIAKEKKKEQKKDETEKELKSLLDSSHN